MDATQQTAKQHADAVRYGHYAAEVITMQTDQAENSIELSRGTASWNAKYLGPHAEYVQSLFETDTLPTPFTPQAKPETVLAEIQKLNPGVSVTLRGEVRP